MADYWIPGAKVKIKSNPTMGVCIVQQATSEDVIEISCGGDLFRVPVDDLERYRFINGTEVLYGPERQKTVVMDSQIKSDGQIIYSIFLNGAKKQVPETALVDAKVGPVTRIMQGEFDDALDFLIHTKAMALEIAYAHHPFVSLSNSRLDPQPHQVAVAHRVVNSVQQRILIADEVGLGKTIEAGMILKEMRARGLIERCLIICPANLVTQWCQELSNKFNESFVIYDSAKVRELSELNPERNVWSLHDNIICSLQFARNEKRAANLAEEHWDLIIFDEAHHLRRYLESSKPRMTLAYKMAQSLAERTDALLLLTATPLQLHPFELYSLAELVDPTLFESYADFDKYRLLIPKLNKIIADMRVFNKLSPSTKNSILAQINSLPVFTEKATTKVNESMLDDVNLRDQIISRIEQEHKLSSVMVRNRKRIVGGFNLRKAKTIRVFLDDYEKEVYHDITQYVKEAYSFAQKTKDSMLGFVMVTFEKLLTSSSRALSYSIGKRIESLRQIDDKSISPEISIDDLEDEDLDMSCELAVQAARSTLEDESSRLDDFYHRVSAIKEDSKLKKLKDLIAEIFATNRKEKVLIFAQFIKTLDT